MCYCPNQSWKEGLDKPDGCRTLYPTERDECKSAETSWIWKVIKVGEDGSGVHSGTEINMKIQKNTAAHYSCAAVQVHTEKTASVKIKDSDASVYSS